MVPAPIMHASYYNNEHALNSAALELKYSHSTHLVDTITKDEDIRRLRFQIHLLENDKEELNQLLQEEEDRADAFERLVDEKLARSQQAEVNVRALENDLRKQFQDITALNAEKAALQHSTADASAALTEKLALTRELSILKPELEHLKAKAASTEALLSEKLALDRQITNLQCELENAKRETQRALAKRRNTGVEIAQEEQMDDLRRQLTKEKRARQRAEEAAETASGDVQIDDVRKQLTKERKARQKAEEAMEAAQEATQVEDVRRDLLKEKKAKAKLEEWLENVQAELEREKKAAVRATKRAEGNTEADDAAEELRNELAKEKKERLKAEKAAQQAAAEFEAQKATLDDKLAQFRTKLRSTKDQLKAAQEELARAQAAADASKNATAAKPTAKANPKKRTAAQMDPDATTLGTPGDGPAAKRSRKAGTGLGNKSTFSITPFLNKTTSVIQEGDEENASIVEPSPATEKAQRLPLAQQPASDANVPVKKPTAQRNNKPKPALEMVTEEAEPEDNQEGQENIVPAATGKAKGQTLKIKTKTTDGSEQPTNKQRPKIRKSLADFASFDPEPEVEKKKKRKLGGLGKTLFDEEDEGVIPLKGLGASARGLFGGKGFGALGCGKKKSGGFLGGSKAVGGASLLITANDGSGFTFSPLKKARRNLDDTLRG